MKYVIACAALVFSFAFTAHAEEMTQIPVDLQTQISTPVESADIGMDIEGHHTGKYNYCCVQSHGGGYCELNYYASYGAPCKCYVGNNASYGHVCN